MKRSIVGLTALTCVAVATASAPAASAATPSWLHVHTVTKATAYNNSTVRITPSATASGQRVITKKVITVYRGGKKYRSGSSAAVPAGHYSTVTSGTYKSYSLASERRTRRVLHEGDYVQATCTVTAATDDGLGGTDSTAGCRNSYYPTQVINDEEYGSYQVGQQYTTYELFDDEYVNQSYSVTVRHYGAAHTFRSAKRRLTVANGGYRRLFVGSGIETTSTFRAPSSTWKISYSWDCSSFGVAGNMIIEAYQSDGDYANTAANRLAYSGSGHSYVHGSGRFYLDINSECDWRVTVTR